MTLRRADEMPIPADLVRAVRACRLHVEEEPFPAARIGCTADRAAWLSAFADGQTSPGETTFLRAHLAECARCRLQLRGFVETRAMIEQAADDDWAPPDLRLRIGLVCRSQRDRRVAVDAHSSHIGFRNQR
jgi:anti-sigma factor RsiW